MIAICLYSFMMIERAALPTLDIQKSSNRKAPEAHEKRSQVDFAFGTKGTVGERLAVYLALKGPDAPSPIREYNSAAVRISPKLPPLRERSPLPNPAASVPTHFARHTTSDGKTFVISTWDGICNPYDLWVFEEVDGRLCNPVFTGRTTYWPGNYHTGELQPGSEKRDSEVFKLLRMEEWISRFVVNRQFARDSDGDGYTDVLERWVGLDPNCCDMDGDGIVDGSDVDPVAPSRKLSREEQIARCAIVTALGREKWEGNPMILVKWPKEMKPFDVGIENHLFLHEYEGMLKREGEANLFGIRVELLSESSRVVKFNKDKSIAEVSVSVASWYDTKYTVQTQKIGQQWLPKSCVRWDAVP